MSKQTKTAAANGNDGGALLSAEDILSGGDEPLQRIELPIKKGGKPGVIYLRPLTAGEVLDFQASDEDQRQEALLELMPSACVNEEGQPIFAGTPKDKLRNMPIVVFTAISQAVTEMAGLTKPAESAEGNASGATPATASPTA